MHHFLQDVGVYGFRGIDFSLIIFNSTGECLRDFKKNSNLAMHKAKPSLKEGMQQWLDTL
jgi:hypothetical protein